MKYVLDSNIFIHYARNSVVWKYVEQNYFPTVLKGRIYLSFAARAETISFSRSHHWGKYKMERLRTILQKGKTIESGFKNLTEAYVNIDLYSQNKHKSLRLPKNFTARNMGKNDLWIAATAHVLDLPLISTDRDFEHLNNRFLNFIYIDVEAIFER
ncbi:MAG: PIN domain-containing protein [Bacteroidota bacterium]